MDLEKPEKVWKTVSRKESVCQRNENWVREVREG